MTPEQLLRELEPLTYVGRVRYMINLGRQVAANTPGAASLSQTLQTFEAGDFYRRYMALLSAQGSRDGAHALRSLSDPSRIIRGLAINLIPLFCDDSQVLQALTAANFETRRALLPRLFKRQRQAVIDEFLAQFLAAHPDDPTRLRLLAYGSARFLAGQRSLVETMSDPLDWAALTRIHPDFVAGVLLDKLARLDRPDFRVKSQVQRLMPHLALRRPDCALELAQVMLKTFSIRDINLQRLVTLRPDAVATLVLSTTDPSNLDFSPVIPRLDTALLIGLLSRSERAFSVRVDVLSRLTPDRRRAIYTALHNGWRTADDTVPLYWLTSLPVDLREAEARRNIALPALATSPANRLPYAGYLPWEEAFLLISPYLGDPDPDLRVAAHSALATVVYYHSDRLPDLLALVRARRNEQDPVRLSMVRGLANIQPSRWTPPLLAELGLVLREAVTAADFSHFTASQLERLVIKILPFWPDWAAEWLAALVKERGSISFFDLSARLSERDVQRIKPALVPVLAAWEKRGRDNQLLAAARSLGRRLKVFNEFVRILMDVLKTTRNSWIASGILDLLGEHRRDVLPGLIPALLKADRSWIVIAPVYTYLHRTRQDLLTPYLGQNAFKGHFSNGKTRQVLPFYSGFQRWTPMQQATFARTLSEVTGDEMRDSPALLTTIRQLQALPGLAPTRLVELASDKRPAVRDGAIRALGRLDAGEGVPVLLDMMNDDRGRLAIYALRRSLLEMLPAAAASILATIPLTRVTVAKEVVRLLGDLRTEGAYRELLTIAGEDLHRDIRVAVLRGLWNYLERAETWPLLEAAAVNPDPAIAAIVGRIPTERLSPVAEGRLVRLLAQLLGHPDARVRTAVLERCNQLPVTDREQVLLPRLVAALESALPGEYTLAASAITATYHGQDAPIIGQVTGRILSRRKVLKTLVDNLGEQAVTQRRQMLPTVQAVLQALLPDPLTAGLQAELAVAGLEVVDLAHFFNEMAGRGDLHEGALGAAIVAVQGIGYRSDAAQLALLEEALRSSPDPRLRRLALAALVGLAGSPQGWDDARLACLHQYRADPAPLVAAAAQFTFPPGE